MSFDPEAGILSVTLDEEVYLAARVSFESMEGPALPDSMEREPRIAYSIFAHRVAEVLALSGAAEPDIMPKLREEAQEVIIQIARRPGFFEALRNRTKEPVAEETETVLRFTVGKLDPRFRRIS